MKSRKSLTAFTLITLISLSNSSWAGTDESLIAVAQKAIDESGFTAQQSIKKVQQLYPGVVYQYELDDDDDEYFHEVKLIDTDADEKIKITLSIEDGEVLSEQRDSLFSWFSWLPWVSKNKNIARVKQLLDSENSLLSAINSIQLEQNSILLDVELEQKQGVLFFEIDSFGIDGEKEWLIDANSNTLIPVFQR
ncbi:MAG: hypothetical protein KUG78_07690 [Kangiellaceae bacterium]|nr:hypothetical protein [Kangiellaceae bacterium]